MTNRRQLEFEDWDAVVADIQALASGYEQNGKWNLEQAARHLNDWLRFPIDGFEPAPFPMRMMLFVMRNTMGKRMLRGVISKGRMPDGGPTAPNTVYEKTSESATQEAVDQLLATIQRFREHQGPIYDSPLFGAMDKETAQQLQFVHFAHHLSWLSPREAG